MLCAVSAAQHNSLGVWGDCAAGWKGRYSAERAFHAPPRPPLPSSPRRHLDNLTTLIGANADELADP